MPPGLNVGLLSLPSPTKAHRLTAHLPGAVLDQEEKDSEEEDEEGVLTYAEERIEDDMELKLHSLSNQTLWARCFG